MRQTPYYVFDTDEFAKRAAMIRAALDCKGGRRIPLCFSIKANPFLLHRLPAGLDHVEVCSPGELEICIAPVSYTHLVEILQGILDKYLETHDNVEIDYIHGDEALHGLVKETKGCGIFLQSIDKSTLFPAINAGGVLPRKTFSIGEANEKRYYMECHKISM